MNYEKPVVNLLASAVSAIQNHTDKTDPDSYDNDMSQFLASASAYAADE
jgi:hypothetical protein